MSATGLRPITWSPSVTVTLTHDCPWHCRYCGFRSDGQGLISESEIQRLLDLAVASGATEVLVLSGERPDTLPHIRQAVRGRGCRDFTEFVRQVCVRILDRGLLPHTNVGALSPSQFERLAPVNASMGLMLENIDDGFNRGVAPEKTAVLRRAVLESAGRARIPFTSGILIGLGESAASRFRSLDVLAASHARHGHLQEVLIQNFVPNRGSAVPAAPPPPEVETYLELIGYWRRVAPGVPVQIPPNLNPHWRALLPWIDDLGGISPDGDRVNPDSPWAPPAVYSEAARACGRVLRHRWAVHDPFVERGWISPAVAGVIARRGGLRKGVA